MSFVLNGTTIPSTYNAIHNGSPVHKLIVNGATVWQKAAPQPTITITKGTSSLTIVFRNPHTEAVTLYYYAGASNTPTYTSETLAAGGTKTVNITDTQIASGTTVYAYAYAVWNGLTSTTTSENQTMPTAIGDQYNFCYRPLMDSYGSDICPEFNSGGHFNGSEAVIESEDSLFIPYVSLDWDYIVINFIVNVNGGMVGLPFSKGYGLDNTEHPSGGYLSKTTTGNGELVTAIFSFEDDGLRITNLEIDGNYYPIVNWFSSGANPAFIVGNCSDIKASSLGTVGTSNSAEAAEFTGQHSYVSAIYGDIREDVTNGACNFEFYTTSDSPPVTYDDPLRGKWNFGSGWSAYYITTSEI